MIMRTQLLASLLALAGSAAWACPPNTIASGVDPATGNVMCVAANVGNVPSGGSPAGQPGGGVTGGGPVKQTSPFPTKSCMTTLAMYASDQLKSNVLADKAVTQGVLDSIGGTTISEAELGSKCASVCQAFDDLTAKITSAKMGTAGPGNPAYVFKSMQYPAMPGQAEMKSCIPVGLTKNWCPKSGSGVGAGPSRIENPLDKIKVCISGGDALANMNFSDADIARGCARPNIVDAAIRIQTEHTCVVDAAQFDAKMKQAALDKAAQDAAAKAPAEKAAANANAQLPNGQFGIAPALRKKP